MADSEWGGEINKLGSKLTEQSALICGSAAPLCRAITPERWKAQSPRQRLTE